MQWVLDNWLILLFVGGMAAMHLFGHGHGGHGRGRHDRDARRHRDTDAQSDHSRCRRSNRVAVDEAEAPELRPVETDRQA